MLAFRMWCVEFDNGGMYVDCHKAASDVRDEFVSFTEKFFFFQAEDGIRDDLVTGVQTCALPLVLTAEPGETFESLDLTVEGVARLPDGSMIVRKAEGPGMIVNVAGASEQGAVDRQRSLTAPWMGLELVTARTKPRAATLEVTMLDRTRMAEGDQIKFRWKWTLRDATQALPKTVSAEMVGSADVRVIDMQADAKDSSTGTFMMTTTRLTRPSKYDIYITGRLNLGGGEQEDIVSRPITVKVDEVGAGNAQTRSRP